MVWEVNYLIVNVMYLLTHFKHRRLIIKSYVIFVYVLPLSMWKKVVNKVNTCYISR